MEEQELKKHLYFLIMSGGGGTRLWPSSRQKTPKQFLDFFGGSCAFQKATDLIREIVPEANIYAITNQDYVDEVVQFGKLQLRNIIAEPQKRNTALAIAVGAAVIAKKDPDAIIVNYPGDNLVHPESNFKDDILTLASWVKEKSCLALVGTKPTYPNTGFGYVEANQEEIKYQGKKIFKIVQFKEKPDQETAQKYMDSGNFYWNASWYTWTAQALLSACQKYSPKIYEEAMAIQNAWGESNEHTVFEEIYNNAEDLAIDYAVSEKADNLYLISATFLWDDLGTWKNVWEVAEKQGVGLAVIGKSPEKNIDCGSQDSLIVTGSRLIATVGLKDVVVVDTDDVLMVCQKDKVQDVKKIVEELKAKNKTEYL
jgi:mannose-1-phosphate guanylyltransferase